MIKYPKEDEAFMIKFHESLDEASQRRYLAIETLKLGHGGKTYIKELFETSYERILRGLQELKQEEELNQNGRIRKEGGGSKGKKTTNK